MVEPVGFSDGASESTGFWGLRMRDDVGELLNEAAGDVLM